MYVPPPEGEEKKGGGKILSFYLSKEGESAEGGERKR